MTINYGDVLCEVAWGRYAGTFRPAVRLVNARTGEPEVTATVNVPDWDRELEPGEVFLNPLCTAAPDRARVTFACGLFAHTGRVLRLGDEAFVIARLLVEPPKDADDDACRIPPVHHRGAIT